MKILLSIFFTILILQANDTSKLSSQVNAVEKEKICKDIKFEEIQQRGCCSHHGGVSGCSNGKVVCNDGSYSPSCTCAIPLNPLG